jgi:hypothetical protein
MSVQAPNGDSGSLGICLNIIHVSLGDLGSSLDPSSKHGRFTTPHPLPNGEHVGGHCSSAEIWGYQIPIQMEFVQVREFQGSSLVQNLYMCGWDIRGPLTCPNGVQNSRLVDP